METRRIYGASRARPRAILAILALLLGLLAAGLPGLSYAVRVAIVALGYVSFVLLVRSALLRWRRDWSSLWRADLDFRPVPPVVPFSKRGHQTFKDAGKVGLCTKADSVIEFDDFAIEPR